jgi:uncharacterized protein YdhG (YjbR/CyaY superfamily)
MKKVNSKEDAKEEIKKYFAKLLLKERKALSNLRSVIKSAAPDAEEVFSYQMPAFRQNGMLVIYAAFKEHCSFFILSSALVKKMKDLLKDYSTSTGTIRFTVDKPLPVSLVKKIVKERIKENELKRKKKF